MDGVNSSVHHRRLAQPTCRVTNKQVLIGWWMKAPASCTSRNREASLSFKTPSRPPRTACRDLRWPYLPAPAPVLAQVLVPALVTQRHILISQEFRERTPHSES